MKGDIVFGHKKILLTSPLDLVWFQVDDTSYHAYSGIGQKSLCPPGLK